jgi:Capsular polysaccharide synthesis protein
LRKIIWTCWLQGRPEAPELVRKCLESWETRNPAWDFRCLDADMIARYVDLNAHVDLKKQTITAASVSDILRLLLLNEYGGVWVDATAYCNVPLDDWLPLAAHTGFFAFARPGEDRELASWFLAAQPGNVLLAKWAARALAYWRGREKAQDYFWVHHQFGELCAIDRDAFCAWQNTPRISADGPHAIQQVGMYEDYDATKAKIDWTVPVFKLTYRLELDKLGPNSLVSRLLGLTGETERLALRNPPENALPTPAIGLLQVGTENLGDHIQILAGEALLRRAGLEPSFLVDRDDGIADRHPATNEAAAALLMNGWFKTNPSQWPPHPAYKLSTSVSISDCSNHQASSPQRRSNITLPMGRSAAGTDTRCRFFARMASRPS